MIGRLRTDAVTMNRRMGLRLAGPVLAAAALVVAGASAASAADVPGTKVCRSGVDGTVCVAVLVQDGHIYGRMGIDAAAGSTICSVYIALTHTVPGGDNPVVAEKYNGGCATGRHIDVITPPATSRCSSTDFAAQGTYTVNGGSGRAIFSNPGKVLC